MISISHLQKLELRVGTVLDANTVDNSEKLINLTVNFGEGTSRQILTGMKKWKSTEDFIGKQFLFITNLESRMMMGLESQGMILAVDGEDDTPVLLIPEKNVSDGAKVR